MENMKHELTALILSIVTSLVIFTYMMKLPYIVMPEHSEIIDEYYKDKMYPNALLDVGFIVVYIGIALNICTHTSAQSYMEPIIVGLVTASLTAFFCFIFNTREKNNNNFFSRWFHEVKYKSVVYDVLLIIMTHIVYKLLLLNLKK